MKTICFWLVSEHSLDVWGRSKELSRVAKYEANVGPESRSQIECYVQLAMSSQVEHRDRDFLLAYVILLTYKVHDL